MQAFFIKLCSVLSSFFVLLGVIFNPSCTKGIFPSEAETAVKTEFDEGEFCMGSYDIVVAVNGSDSNPGTLEQPLKTPLAAKEKAKTLKGIADETVTVWFREGIYVLSDTLSFTSDDLSNVIYRSYPNETVVFSGSKEISGWNETKINGIDAFVTDIEINSDENYFRSLFKGNKRLPRSAYPKEGVFTVASVSNEDAIRIDPDETNYFTISAAFYANENEILDFANPTDVDVRLMHYWCDELMPVHSVNAQTGRIETAKGTSMTVKTGDNFVYENVKEALTLPGEWYLDRSEGKLYYIPEEGDTTENTVLYAADLDKLLDINRVSGIAFQGINFEKTDWNHIGGRMFENEINKNHPLYANIKYGATHPQAASDIPSAINVSNSSEISFINCRFENISYSAVMFAENTTVCSVESCLFSEIGANAIYIKGNRAVPATTNNINVIDCHIRNYGRIYNNAIGIFLIDAADCVFQNNEIHDGWYTGISVGWVWGYDANPTNGIKILNNLIYNIGNGWLSDMGGIYTLGVQPDTVISGNVIYNVGCYGGEGGYGGWGIYLDEGSTEITVENNLVYDCSSQCFHQHYGRDNVIRNNIFAFGGEGQFRITRNEEHNSLYLENNILVGYNTPMYYRTTDENWFVDNSNLYWDYKTGGNVYSGSSTKIGDRENLVRITAKGYYNNAVFENPLFKDTENRDFTLAENSPALEAGFKPWKINAGTLTLFE